MLETKTVGLVEIPLQQEVAKDLIQRSKAKFCYYQSQDGAQCMMLHKVLSAHPTCPPLQRYSLPNGILHTLTQIQSVHQT